MRKRFSPIFILLTLLNLTLFNFCLIGCSETELLTLYIENGTWIEDGTDLISDNFTEFKEPSDIDTEAVTISIIDTERIPPETEGYTDISIETGEETVYYTNDDFVDEIVDKIDIEPSSVITTDITVVYETTSQADLPNTTAVENQTEFVYWVKNGEVWHVSRECSSLSRSKEILTGTVSEAIQVGKERVCKRCGG
jgi:hypothetical protein